MSLTIDSRANNHRNERALAVLTGAMEANTTTGGSEMTEAKPRKTDDLERDDHGRYILPLQYPVQRGKSTEPVAQVHIRRPKVSEIKKFFASGGGSDGAQSVLAVMSVADQVMGQPAGFFDDMDTVDGFHVLEVIGDLLGEYRKTGKD